MLNLPVAEASEDLRMVMAGGALFGGKQGSEYIEQLQEMSIWDDDALLEAGRSVLRSSDLERESPSNGDRNAENPIPNRDR